MQEYRKIKTTLKSSRINPPANPEPAEIWRWLRDLRENDATTRVYDVDPYVEVHQVRDNIFALYTENADGLGDVWMYLIIGPEKAMLIDTSFGIGNLRALCDEITGGMPLVVVNTHSHPDHAYGDCQFERVYCHEYMVPYIQGQNEHIWDYLFDAEGNNKWLNFDRNDLVRFKPFEVIGCPDGHVFHLGGDFEMELVFLPGHQAGHCGFLDKKDRILFSGDGICSDRVGIGGSVKPGQAFIEFATVTHYKEALERLAARLDEFDTIFPQHYIIGIDKRIIPASVKTCEAIIAKPEDWDFKTETKGFSGGVVYYGKFIDGYGNTAISYKEGRA